MKEAILQARKRMAGQAHVTPVMTSRTLNDRVGAEVFLKCENLQRAGAFKFRGAYNAITRLTPEQRARGVITYSSGNHAQAVALVGKMLGIPVTVVMPENVPRVLRGGAFYNIGSYLRCSFRSANNPYYRNYFIGFRVAAGLTSSDL